MTKTRAKTLNKKTEKKGDVTFSPFSLP